jgi:hypothetical protein
MLLQSHLLSELCERGRAENKSGAGNRLSHRVSPTRHQRVKSKVFLFVDFVAELKRD